MLGGLMKANDPSKRVQRRYKENLSRLGEKGQTSLVTGNIIGQTGCLACVQKAPRRGGVGARREREHGRGSKAEKRRLEGVAGYDV